MSKFSLQELLTGTSRRASHVERYSSRQCVRRENVAEHSWYASYYSLIIAKHLEQQGFKVDLAKLLERALVHDLDETRTGDFIRPVKYGYPGLKELLDQVSESCLQELSGQLGVDVLTPWKHCKADDLEGQILKVSDLLCVVAYADEELKFGNRHFIIVFKECRAYLQELATSSLSQTPLARIIAEAIVYIDDELSTYRRL